MSRFILRHRFPTRNSIEAFKKKIELQILDALRKQPKKHAPCTLLQQHDRSTLQYMKLNSDLLRKYLDSNPAKIIYGEN